MTHTDLERIAYANGDTQTAAMFAALADIETIEDALYSADLEFDWEKIDGGLVDAIDAIQTETLEKNAPDHDAYVSFFERCFKSLNSHWPCAKVTDDGLCNVLYEAIARGDVEDDAA